MRLALLLCWLLACCSSPYHIGHCQYELYDSFYVQGRRYEIYKCVKDCPRTDTFPSLRLHLIDSL